MKSLFPRRAGALVTFLFVGGMGVLLGGERFAGAGEEQAVPGAPATVEDAPVLAVRSLGSRFAAGGAGKDGDTRTAPRVSPTSELHLFANPEGRGAMPEVTLEIEAPLGTRAQVQADLFQVAAGSLAATLRRNLPVAEALTFDDRTLRRVVFPLPTLPPVAKAARFVLRFRIRAVGSADWLPGGEVRLFVDPSAETEVKGALAAGLRANGLGLGIFGESRAIRQFFKDQAIEFTDLGPERPANPEPKTLLLGELPAEKPGDWPPSGWAGRLIVVGPRLDLPPGVYVLAGSGGSFVAKLTLPHFAETLATDPLAQRALAQILRQALAADPGLPANPTALDGPDHNNP